MKSPTKSKLSPLHCHTGYSVLDAASSIDDYLKYCKENELPGMAVTDHGWMIGALEVHAKAKKAGMIGIPGVELYVAPDKDYQFAGKPYSYYHVTVWAVNEVGYRNLLKLGSLSFKQDEIPLAGWLDKEKTKFGPIMEKRVITRYGSPKPRVTFDELLTYNEGLVIGTGCLIGSINKALLQGEYKGAEMNLLRLMEVYKGRMFTEIMPHNCSFDFSRTTKTFEKNPCTDFSPDGDLQRSCNLMNIDIARKYDIPLLMTVDSHFTTPDRKVIQDLLLQNGDEAGWHFKNSYHHMNTDECWDHWKVRYGTDMDSQRVFCESVENNDLIFELARDMTITDPYRIPSPEFTPEIRSSPDLANDSERIKASIFQQIESVGRMKWDNEVWVERLGKEISVICDNKEMDFGPYFMFLWKWNKWTRDHSILSGPGRGSGSGSLLCFVMGITHLDPIKWNLPFERFLSDARIARKKWPDIDWDLGNREPLLAALEEFYGDKFAQCSVHGTIKVKSAIKDACRAMLGWNGNDDRVMAITKTVELTPMGVNDKDFLLGYKDAEGTVHDGHLMQNAVLDNFFKENPEVYKMVMDLLGIPKSVGRHASAYFISDSPISDCVPTAVIGGHTVTQYTTNASNNWAEAAGLVKFDFLRINTLDFVASAIRLAQEKMGHKVWTETETIGGKEFKFRVGELPITTLPMPDGTMVDMYDLPDDPAVFADLSSGKTESVFQLLSSLMTGFTVRIKPSRLSELSDIVALVRPGPLAALLEDGKTTMTEAYIGRKAGILPVTYAHPDMEPILKDTFGVMVYQEQLQNMFMILAGYTLEEADYLREVLAKKKRQDMEKALPDLRRRLEERNWNETQIQVFVGLCISSSAYSFNLAHSAAYGTVGYWCAWMKHYYPLEWWTSVLRFSKMEDIRSTYAKIVKDYLVMPHVNGPSDDFDLIGEEIHAPMYLIEGIGTASINQIRDERQARGDFLSLQDFFERVNKRIVNQNVFHQLIICDTFKKVEPGKTPKMLLEEYHYLKKVVTLKAGEGQTGEILRKAISAYKEKEEKTGKRLEVPELYMDSIDLEITRMKAMPIYKLDVHDHFQELLRASGFMIAPDRTTYRTPNGISIHVLRNVQEIERNKAHLARNPACWIGLLQEVDTFRYKDKKTGKMVTALKMQIANDGDVIEAIVWPNLYEQIGKPKENKLVAVFGNIRESREPGKWSLTVDKMVMV